MRDYRQFYIDGVWVDPVEPKIFEVENPATEQPGGRISLGSAADIDKAVKAARRAFATWSMSSREDRLALLERIAEEYQKRAGDMGDAIAEEMGSPISLARGPHVFMGSAHLAATIDVLRSFVFEEDRGSTRIVREPIGVCGLITPWNLPINQIAVKVFPAPVAIWIKARGLFLASDFSRPVITFAGLCGS